MAIAPIHNATSLPAVSDTGSIRLTQDSPSSSKAGGFQSLITNGIDGVNNDLNKSSQMSREFLTQGKHELHEVMISLDQADLSFRYMMQIRSKVLDAYGSIMGMQV